MLGTACTTPGHAQSLALGDLAIFRVAIVWQLELYKEYLRGRGKIIHH